MREDELKKRYVEYLNTLNIHIVRSLARAVGVANPTKGLKDELIDRTVSVLLGEIPPTLPSGRGAPIREEPIDQRYMDELSSIRERVQREEFAAQCKTLSQSVNRMEVRSDADDFLTRWQAADREEAKDRREGILEILPSGEGILRNADYTAAEEELFVSREKLTEFDLKEGDFLSGTFEPGEEGGASLKKVYVVNNLVFRTKGERTSFEELLPGGTKKILFSVRGDGEEKPKNIYRGQKVMISAADTPAALRRTDELLSSLSYGVDRFRVMGLFLSASDGVAEELRKRYRASETATLGGMLKADRVQAAKVFFARVARLAEERNNVIVVVDSVDELIRLCNVGQTQRMLDCGLSVNAFIPVKRWMSLARDTACGGSVTIIAGLKKGNDETSRLIYEEIEDMTDHHLSVLD